MALTKATTGVIATEAVHSSNLASDSVTTAKILAAAVDSTKVDDSVIKTITLTQAAYDALGSYNSSTIYITT